MSQRRNRTVSYDDPNYDDYNDEDYDDYEDEVDPEFLQQCMDFLDDKLGDYFTYEEKHNELWNAEYIPETALQSLLKIQAQRKAKEEKKAARAQKSPAVASKPVRHQSDSTIVREASASRHDSSQNVQVFRHGSAGTLDKSGSTTNTETTAKQRLPTSQKGSGRTKKIEADMLAPPSDSAKDRMNLVVIGHVDAGKSTMMGHLLHALGNIDKRVIHKNEKESRQAGKASFSFAWLMDQNEQERERGITMDVATTHFETKTKKVTLLDAPGHRDFIPNMISGAAQADVAILVVDSCTNAFEAGFVLNGQTKEHAILARSFGVSQLIIAVNKLETLDWDESRFNYIKAELDTFLKSIGFKTANLVYIPVSGFHGENLAKRDSEVLSAWYSGPTLVDAIDNLSPTVRQFEAPFRCCITDVFNTQSLGSIAVAGKVEAGCVAQTDNLILLPANLAATVKSIENHGQNVPWARAGDNIELGLSHIDKQFVTIGSFLCDPARPIPVTKKIQAQLITFAITRPLIRGDTVELFSASFQEVAKLSKLLAILNKSTGETTRQNPRTVMKNSTALVEITLTRAVCMEVFSQSKTFGRFTIRKQGETLAAGIVTEILQA